MGPDMTPLVDHPEINVVRLQVKKHPSLLGLSEADYAALEPHLEIFDARKGDFLRNQGERDMVQYFVLEGILKRVVSNPAGKEMILRFSNESNMETSYAAWRTGTPMPYAIVSVTKARVACLPLEQWGAFLEQRAELKQRFELSVMKVMTEIMSHIITLHLLDAPGRFQRFERKHPDMLDRLPQKELASYLNLAPETLSRLKHSGKI